MNRHSLIYYNNKKGGLIMDLLNDIIEQYKSADNQTIAIDDTTISEAIGSTGFFAGLKDIINDETGCKLVAAILQVKAVNSYIQYLVRASINGDKLQENDYQNLVNLIFLLQTIYNYSGTESPVSDYDYDRLYELMESYDTEMITTPIIGNEKIVNHKYTTLRGTLKKVYALGDEDALLNKSRRTLDEWIAECEKMYEAKTGQKISLNSQDVYVFPKWDGISITFEFDERGRLSRALTRGNTETNEAQDVTHVFAAKVFTIRDTKLIGKEYGLKTEVMVKQQDKDSYNKKYNESYKNTRSIASSIINSDTCDGRENLLEIVKLRTVTKTEDGEENLQELADEVFERPYLVCPLSDRAAIRKFAEKHRSIGGLNTDGAVIYIIDENIRKVLGRKDNKNQYEVAYKFNEDVGYTKVKDIEFSVTPFGRIFPVVKLDKIVLKGNDIRRVSLGSIARMMELGLRKGDTVKVMYEIIPYVTMDEDDPKCKRTKNPIIKLPTRCPECGEAVELTANATGALCPNPECPCRLRGKIITFVDRMGLKDIGEATIRDLINAKLVTEIPDLYKLRKKKELIQTMEGYGEVSATKIIKEIESHREVSAEVFMSAIGIESIGKKTFEKILKKYHIDELLLITKANKISMLVSIPGIAEVQAKKIIAGVNQQKKLIKELLKELTITYPDDDNAAFIAVFHKIRSRKLAFAIELAGGRVDDNLTKKTSFLIVPNGHRDLQSTTSDKARRYGVPIVEIDEVENYIKRFNKEE